MGNPGESGTPGGSESEAPAEVASAKVDGPLARAPAPDVDPFTAMTARFGRVARVFGERFFPGFRLDPGEAEQLRELEERGAVVYVMRYSSRLDYFLFNWLFLRERLRLATFANGIWFYYYRPLTQAVPLLLRGVARRIRRGFKSDKSQGLEFARNVTRLGGTMFLFLRTDKLGLGSRRRTLRSGRSESDYLRAIVETTFDEKSPVFLVPLALFWRKGPRPTRRFLNLFYGAPERPTDSGKVLSFLWNYRNLAVRVGTPIDLAAFTEARRGEEPERIARKVRRSVLIFLRREEKPVEGASLRPLYRIEELVARDREVQQVISDLSGGSRRAERRLQSRARRMLRKIAANPSPSALAVLDVVVGRLFQRLFERFEVRGIERVADAAKLHPLVLVPTHRSHFDYLILSWLFYERHLVPPVVAAGDNLSFWPLGPIFRRGGAYFLRRSFDGDPLYSTVFRRYVQQLIKDGATQEFFIEGSRSRTGKTLPPRLGMLGMVLEAYARGVRRDVYVVPVGFTYERVVEEAGILEERSGKKKGAESLFALLRARSLLRERFGTASVRFGEPISLAELVEKHRELLADPGPERKEERREVVHAAGLAISHRLNGLVTAGRSNVPAAVLLAARGHGVRRDDLVARSRRLVEILAALGVEASDALRVDLDEELAGSLAALEASGLVSRLPDPHGEIVYYEDAATNALDFYRAGLAPVLAIGGLVSLSDEPGGVAGWLRWLRIEYLPPEGEALDHAIGRVRRLLRPDDRELLARQVIPALIAYEATFRAVRERAGKGTRQGLEQAGLGAVRSAILLGRSRPNEAANRALVANALTVLVEEEVLELDGAPRDPAARLGPGPRWAELERALASLAQGVPGD